MTRGEAPPRRKADTQSGIKADMSGFALSLVTWALPGEDSGMRWMRDGILEAWLLALAVSRQLELDREEARTSSRRRRRRSVAAREELAELEAMWKRSPDAG